MTRPVVQWQQTPRRDGAQAETKLSRDQHRASTQPDYDRTRDRALSALFSLKHASAGIIAMHAMLSNILPIEH